MFPHPRSVLPHSWSSHETGQREETISPASLLKLLLPVAPGTTVFATRSFEPWVEDDDFVGWPPPADSSCPLWLVDTKDLAHRAVDDLVRGILAPGACEAALILSGSEAGGGFLARLLRALPLLRPGRVPADRIESALAGSVAGMDVRRLGYEAGPGVPGEYVVAEPRLLSGQAFLLSRRPFLGSSLWGRIREVAGEGCRILSFELRVRGAVIVHVETNSRKIVVRVVPPGSEQQLVYGNHSALAELYGDGNVPAGLLEFIPEPLFEVTHDPVLLLGETRIPGTLAWKLASGPLESTMRRNARDFLSELADATRRPEPLTDGEVRSLIGDDLERLEAASFVDDGVRAGIREELERVSELLAGLQVHPCRSHGDYGYGNLLVDPDAGTLNGVIDWGTSRAVDVPGVDRLNLEIQRRRTLHGESFSEALRAVWRNRADHEISTGNENEARTRALVGLASCRYVLRALDFPRVYERQARDFAKAISFLRR